MQINFINDIEFILREKLPINKRQQIISAYNLFRETVRNVQTTMLQIITRKLQISQNEFFEINRSIERKLSELLNRDLTNEEIVFLRQNLATMNNSLIQAQSNFMNKIFLITRLTQSEIEALLRKHNLTIDITNG
ncbi:MAG TPA: hypothetical protein HPP56_07350 [Nitrospirae bacterium]|nr:hypothetical protein [Nitrospirota bacterium]